MNPEEYQSFLDRIFHGSPDPNSVEEMNSFAEQPESIRIILNSISSNILRRENLLISLSYIPKLKIPSPNDMENLKSWFNNFCFIGTEYLLSNDFLALMADIFYFLYQDQPEGSELITKLTESDQPQHNLAIQITLRIIERMNSIPNPEESLSMALVTFFDKNSAPALIDSSTLLLQQLLLPKQYGLQFVRSDLPHFFFKADENGQLTHSIFRYIHAFHTNEPKVSVHLLQVINNILLLPPSVFPYKVRANYFRMILKLFFNYLSKVTISEQHIPIISSIFLSFKKASSVIIRENKLNDSINQNPSKITHATLYDELIVQFSQYTQFILENVHYYQYLESILEFWNHHEQAVDFINNEVEKGTKSQILEIIMTKFFTVEVFHYDDIIEQILTDQSSSFIQKLVDFAAFDIFNVAERVTTFMLNELGPNNINIVTLCIEFLLNSSNFERLSKAFDNILDAVFFINTKVPPATSVILEVSLTHFLQTFIKKFDSIEDQEILKQIGEKYSHQLVELFLRLLIDIQTPNCSIEIVQSVLNLLHLIKHCRTEKTILILMNDGRVFNLFNEIQSNSTQENQTKKMIVASFSLLFQFGFLLPTPEKITSLVDLLTSRLEVNLRDSLVYLMIAGGFMCDNCKCEDFCNLLNAKFFKLMMSLLRAYTRHLDPTKLKQDQDELLIETINPRVYIDILHLFHRISEKFLIVMDFMSPFVIHLTDQILNVLDHAFTFISKCKPDSIDFLKNMSLVFLIMSNLLKNKSINFSIFQYYENMSYLNVIEKIFDLFLRLSFDVLLQYPKLIRRYLLFMKSLFGEDIGTFLSLDEIFIQHHLQILNSILNLDNKELSLESADILRLFISSLNKMELQMIRNTFNTVISQIIQSALCFVFKRDIIDETINKLIYYYLLEFPKQRQDVFDRIFVSVENDDIQNKLHSCYAKITNSFEEMNEIMGARNLSESLKAFLYFTRNNQITIPF